jgi:hypothetical protein
VVWGLDMRFLGRKWQKKNKSKNKGNKINRFALRTTVRRYTPTSKDPSFRAPSSAERWPL